jgi:hypothetical protein
MFGWELEQIKRRSEILRVWFKKERKFAQTLDGCSIALQLKLCFLLNFEPLSILQSK